MRDAFGAYVLVIFGLVALLLSPILEPMFDLIRSGWWPYALAAFVLGTMFFTIGIMHAARKDRRGIRK